MEQLNLKSNQRMTQKQKTIGLGRTVLTVMKIDEVVRVLSQQIKS